MTAPSPALESMYQEVILDHYKHPHHKGLQADFDAEVHHVNPTCGDEVTLRVRVRGGTVDEVTYDGQGCSISQASTSVMTDLVTGRRIDDALAVQEEFLVLMQGRGRVEPDEETLEDAVAFSGVARYPARVKCALLGWMAWKDATAQAVAADGATAQAVAADGATAQAVAADGATARAVAADGATAPSTRAEGETA